MKKMTILIATLIGLVVCAFNAQADDDVRVSYSKLPAKAKAFIETYFGSNPKTKEIEREVHGGKYSVELRNGYDLEFDSNGELIEIDSPDRTNLAAKIVKGVLPAKAVQYLQSENLINNVDGVKVFRNGDFLVDVETRGEDYKYRFDSSGNLLR